MRKLYPLFLSAILMCSCSSSHDKVEELPKDTLRIAVEGDPQTLDPRLSRTLLDTTVMHMLYEGLMHIGADGKPEYSLAEKITVSQDLKTYYILLKESQWSDGSPVTAADFVDTWKSMLDPTYPSPNASQLFVIKGAREAKHGAISLDNIGLRVISDLVFTIELENPTAYFEELLSSHFFLPQHNSVRKKLQSSSPESYVYNGPFVLAEWKHHNQLTFVKNNRYWNAANVHLREIDFVVTDETLALTFFQQGKLDWAGSPLSVLPQDAIPQLKQTKELNIAEACGTYWFRFNMAAAPFNEEKMRKAFNLALNRNEIVRYVTQGNQQPALGILPPPLTLQRKGFFADNNIAEAKLELHKALESLKLSKEELPSITLCYSNTERHHKIAQAVQQQWQSAFDIPISLQACESKVSYDKIAKGNYQIMLGSWFADFADPINFLNLFYSVDPEYARLLDQSNLQGNPVKRSAEMLQAETLLINKMPVAPLFFNAFNYVKKDYVSGVYFSPLGYLDFKHAQLNGNHEISVRE